MVVWVTVWVAVWVTVAVVGVDAWVVVAGWVAIGEDELDEPQPEVASASVTRAAIK